MSRRPFATSPIKKAPKPNYPENAPPTNTVPSGQTSYVNATKYFSASGGNQLLLDDVDTPLVTATLITTNGKLTVIPNPGVIITNNTSLKVMVIGSVENVNRALNGMYLQPPTSFSSTLTITLRTSDGKNVQANSFTVVISGTAPPPPPQAPINYVAPGTRSTPYETSYTFPANSVSVYDADTANVNVTVNVVNGGRVNINLTSGAVTTGNGSPTVTISGTQAQVNGALAGLVFTPHATFSGIAKIDLTTSDGALTDVDSFTITVDSPQFGPINAVPAGTNVNRNTPLRLRSYPDNTEFRVATAYKPTLETRIKAFNGTIDAVVSAPPSGSGLLSDGFPAKVLVGHWPGWGTQNVKDISMSYNIITLCCMANSGDGLDNGSVTWAYPGWPLALDVQTVRTRGQKVFLTIGGGTHNRFWYTTRQQSTNLLNSIIPFINSLGGVDGIDFWCFDGSTPGTVLGTEAVYIAQQLKATYGANFAIMLSFHNWPAEMKNLVAALNNANCLTMMQCKYTDYAGYKNVGAVLSTYTTISNESSIPGVRHLAGFGYNYDDTVNLTLAEAQREWDSLVTFQPSVRGMSCYTTATDAANYGTFSSNMKNGKLGNASNPGNAAITGQNTKELVVVGNLSQVNSAIAWMNYTPDPAYFGTDSITMTTSDGTLSDVDVMPLNVL